MKRIIVVLSAFSLLTACSETADAQPTLTKEYLTGSWAEIDGTDECNGPYGAPFQYTAKGEIPIEDSLEPYEIRGNEIHYYNPIDGDYNATFDQIVPVDANTMRLRMQNSDWLVLTRCQPGNESQARPVATEFASSNTADLEAGAILLSNCRMDSCLWDRVISFDYFSNSNEEAVLSLLTQQGFSIHSRDQKYPTQYSKNISIDWEPEQRQSFIRCSRDRPAVANFYDGELHVDHLDLFEVFGPQTSSAISYLRVCHGLEYQEDMASDLRALGYLPGTLNDQSTISGPEDL